MLSSTAKTYHSFGKTVPLINRAHVEIRESMLSRQECENIQAARMGCTYVLVRESNEKWHFFYINKKQLMTWADVSEVQGLPELLQSLMDSTSNRRALVLKEKISALIFAYHKGEQKNEPEAKPEKLPELSSRSWLKPLDDFIASPEWEDFNLGDLRQASESEAMVAPKDDSNTSSVSRWISGEYWATKAFNFTADLLMSGRENKPQSSATTSMLGRR